MFFFLFSESSYFLLLLPVSCLPVCLSVISAPGLKVELEDIIYSFAASDAMAIETSKKGHGGSSSGRTHRSDPVRAHAQYNYPTYHTGDLSEETIAALIAQLESAETSQAMSGAETGQDGDPAGGSDLRVLLLEQLNAIGQLRSSTMTEQGQEQQAGGAGSGSGSGSGILIPTNRTRERDRERDRAIRQRGGRVLRAQQDTLQMVDDAFAMGPNQNASSGGNGAPRLIRRQRDRTAEEGLDRSGYRSSRGGRDGGFGHPPAEEGLDRSGYRSSRGGRGGGFGHPPGNGETGMPTRGNINEEASILSTPFEEGRGDEEINMSHRDRAQMRAVNISLQADEEAALNMAILLSLRERGVGGREFQDDINTDGLQGNVLTASTGSGSGVQSVVRANVGRIQSSTAGGVGDLLDATSSEMAAVAALELTEAADPSEEDIHNLISMGFGRKEVITALKSSGNNIEVAADLLLIGAP